MLGLLLFKGGDIVLYALAAAALHEAGHIAALYALGGRIRSVDISAGGISIRTDGMQLRGAFRCAAVISAGCAVNTAAAAIGLLASGIGTRLYIFACANAALCLLNILPHSSLDGGRLLALATEANRHARRICLTADISVTALLAASGAAVFMYTRYNLTAFLLALCLLAKLKRIRSKTVKKS